MLKNIVKTLKTTNMVKYTVEKMVISVSIVNKARQFKVPKIAFDIIITFLFNFLVFLLRISFIKKKLPNAVLRIIIL